jgi:Protein of unknown function (DUF3179).
VLAALGAAGLAGCLSLTRDDSDREGRADTGDTNERSGATASGEELAALGRPATICETEPLADPGIYAIDEPAVGTDWSGVSAPKQYGDSGRLIDDEVIIGIERDGRRRAYPLSIVWHHEAVNDTLGGPLLITYCPLCNSAMVAERMIDDRPTTFEVTGQLWLPPEARTRASEADDRTFGASRNTGEAEVRNTGNLVLVENATGSYWSQILAEAICGPRAGDRLTVVPATVATWGKWREQGETEVLLPPPASGTVA